MFENQRTQKKLEKEATNRQAQEEKLQVTFGLRSPPCAVNHSIFSQSRIFSNLFISCRLCLRYHQETEKEIETLSRYKKQLENTNSRLESELEETKKLMASRDQVSQDGCIVIRIHMILAQNIFIKVVKKQIDTYSFAFYSTSVPNI